MMKVSRILPVIFLSLAVLFAGSALAKDKAKGPRGDFDFAKTCTLMQEMETRPDFPVAMVLANDYAYSLRALGGNMAPTRKAAIVAYIRNSQQKNGGFVADKANKSSSIVFTDTALDTLGILNAVNAVDIAGIKAFVVSLRNPDGGFGFSHEAKGSSLAATYYAVHILNSINGLTLLDKTKTIAFVKGFEKPEGGFGFVRGKGTPDAKNTYMATYVLNALGALDASTRKNAIKFLATTPYGGSKAKAMADLDEQLYAIKALKVLKAADRIDRKIAMAFLKRLYIKVNGGFGPIVGYGASPDSTTEALRVLAELDMLKGAHVAVAKVDTYSKKVSKPMHKLPN